METKQKKFENKMLTATSVIRGFVRSEHSARHKIGCDANSVVQMDDEVSARTRAAICVCVCLVRQLYTRCERQGFSRTASHFDKSITYIEMCAELADQKLR